MIVLRTPGILSRSRLILGLAGAALLTCAVVETVPVCALAESSPNPSPEASSPRDPSPPPPAPDLDPGHSGRPGRSWWPAAAMVAGGIAVAYSIDEPTRDFVLERRDDGWETFADIARPFGEWPVFVPVAGGLLATGLIADENRLKLASARVALSIALGSLASGGMKWLFGRPRPSTGRSGREFDPFSGETSFPSGHTETAFALATTLADEIDRTWATVGLFTLAAASGYARLVDNLHWHSDIVAGAALGYFAAKVVRNHILPPGGSGTGSGAGPGKGSGPGPGRTAGGVPESPGICAGATAGFVPGRHGVVFCFMAWF